MEYDVNRRFFFYLLLLFLNFLSAMQITISGVNWEMNNGMDFAPCKG